MKIKFTKMHALGNDFIVIDNRKNFLKNPDRLSEKICDRRFGIGTDQVLLLCSAKTADFRMRIFNPDGSEVEMCGNGIRCLGKYIYENKITRITGPLKIETLAGIIVLQKKGNLFRVDMGEPILEAKDIPVKAKGRVINMPLKIKNTLLKATCVSMGNPHAVFFTKKVDKFRLKDYGPLIEKHPIFPNRTNVEFIEVLDRKNIRMRVWERGAGETMACGTGASASAVASNILRMTERTVTVHLPGGKLKIEWSEKNNHVYMTGPAVKVFEGVYES